MLLANKMSVSIKAYLLTDEANSSEEIRRFGIDLTDPPVFQHLQEKIQKLYPVLGGFSVQWRDDEGDLITVSSDDELIAAMEASKDSLFRIYVRSKLQKDSASKKSTQTDAGQSFNELHSCVTCDGCQGAVYGFRYKCLNCPDYDLCHDCESKQLHPQHMMLRLPKPMDAHQSGLSFMPWFFARHGGRHRHGRHGWPFMGGHKRRSRFDDNSHRDAERPEEATNEQARFNYPSQFQQAFEKLWTVLGGLPKEQQCSENQNTKEAESNHCPPQDFLRTVGETVAAMLDPLGVDVDVDIEHNGNRQHCGNSTNCHSSASSDKAAPNNAPVNTVPVVNENATAATENQTTVGNGAVGVTNIDAPSQTSEDQTPIKNDQVIIPILEEHSNLTNPPPKAAENENGDWTYIDEKERAQIPPTLTPTTEPSNEQNVGSVRPKTGPPTASIADEINLMSSQAEHPNPTIKSALNQMLAMGFTNEGGWLTQLLEVKNGNIDSVLDVLTPVNKNKN